MSLRAKPKFLNDLYDRPSKAGVFRKRPKVRQARMVFLGEVGRRTVFTRISSLSLPKRAAFFTCCGVMFLCVLAQGLYFYARDGVTPDPLPWAFTLSDWLWALLAVSVFFYLKKPFVTIVISWLVFVVTVLILERFAGDHSVLWFLYRYSLILGFIAASHMGIFIRRRKQDSPAGVSRG